MMDAVDPLLQGIEASPRAGEYAVTLVMADGQPRSVLARVTGAAVEIPAANLGGWAESARSYRAMVTAIAAVHEARTAAGAQRVLLQDIDGGWDVSLGNIVLGDAGQPVCIAHGDLEPRAGARYVCADCGAQGRFGEPETAASPV